MATLPRTTATSLGRRWQDSASPAATLILGLSIGALVLYVALVAR